jgi:hypothetical protein
MFGFSGFGHYKCFLLVKLTFGALGAKNTGQSQKNHDYVDRCAVLVSCLKLFATR